MDESKKIKVFEEFKKKESEREKLPVTGDLDVTLDYCEYVIHGEYDKNSKSKMKAKKRKGVISEEFMRAFGQLNMDEKTRYYIKNVTYLVRISNNFLRAPVIQEEKIEGFCFTRTLNIKMWKKKSIKINLMSHVLLTERQNKIKQFNLGDYIFRFSKSNQYYSFVLEAIYKHVHQNYKTVHIGFDKMEDFQRWANVVQLCIDYKHWERIYAEITKNPPPRLTSQSIRNTQLSIQQSLSNQKITIQNSNQNTVIINQSNEMQEAEKQIEIKKQSMKQLPSQKQRDRERMKESEVQEEQKIISNPNIESEKKIENSDSSSQVNENNQRNIIEDIVDLEKGLQNIKQIKSRNLKKQQSDETIKNINFFKKLFPDYDLNSLEQDQNFEMIQNEQNYKIMQDLNIREKFKIKLTFQNIKEEALCQAIYHAICAPEFFPQFNQNISDFSIKTFISSQNSAIMYMSNKSYNKLYRIRDFIFLRHGFSVGENKFYLVDKNIENENYPPFITVVRGEYSGIWGVIKKKHEIQLIGEITMNNEGYIYEPQNTNLTLKFLREFKNLKEYVQNNLKTLQKYKMFDINWDISKNLVHQKSQKASQMNKQKTKKQQNKSLVSPNSKIRKEEQNKQNMPNKKKQKQQITEQQVKISQAQQNMHKQQQQQHKKQKQQQQEVNEIRKNKINESNLPERTRQQSIIIIEEAKKMMQVQGQIKQSDVQYQTVSEIKLNFDSKGFVIIDQSYRKTKYPTKPLPNQKFKFLQPSKPGNHPIWEDNFIQDKKQGGLLFVNQKKLKDQKGVLKFVLSRIGKNLISGKSVLNISLPVDIFLDQSNLELFARSLGYAPLILEPSVPKNSLSRFKAAVSFGLSMSPIYLNMEKPFNPILGQTFQAWINGCPLYAEQISHHPPISSIYFKGRGYIITAQLEAKINLHMNSGEGKNEGVFKIHYDDGNQICFTSPSGEVGGLTYGDRTFNLVGKAYCWDQKNRYFLEIVFNPSKKGFFSVGKQENPKDYMQGTICEVKPEFFKSFLAKKKSPTDAEIVNRLGKISGIWVNGLNFNDTPLLDFNKEFPLKMEYQKAPLPSDSNWREDIAYRRLMQVQKSQSQKERLQILQRGDRKLRQKFNKKK